MTMKTTRISQIIFILAILLFPLSIGAQSGLQNAEYFVDSDPGEGLGTAMTAQDGNFQELLEGAYQSISSQSEGEHLIGIRFQDSLGVWGPVFRSIVSVQSPITARDYHLTQAEYFWDSDPGEGSASALVVFDGDWNEALENANALNQIPPSPGNHSINLRFLGLDGNWSNVFTTVISVEEPIDARDFKLTQAEYFWDTDPGQGSGTPLLISDGDFNEALESVYESDISPPSLGIHSLNIRFLGLDGIWSNVFTTLVSSEEPITARNFKLTMAEFFWDTDPGEGSGTPLLVADGGFNEAMETVAANSILSPGIGLHSLNIRFVGLDGNWSNVFTTVVTLEDIISARDFRLNQMEVLRC